MFLIKLSQRIIHILSDKLNSAIVRIRYNEWTIAEHFRKQGAQIGDNCYFHTRSLGGQPYLINIGNHVFISRDVLFHTHDGGAWILTEEVPGIDIFGTITIEDNCMIGARAQLLTGVRIGKNSIVGAGSVVITDVPPDSVVMGIPARVIGSTQKYREKCLEKWKIQKPPGYEIEPKFDWRISKSYKESQKKIRTHLINVLNKQDADKK